MNLQEFFDGIIIEEGDDDTAKRDKLSNRIKELADELERSDPLSAASGVAQSA